MSQERDAEPTGRRRFLGLLGLVGMSSLLGAPASRLVTAAPVVPAAAKAPPDSTATAPEGPSGDAVALAGIVQRRHGAHLDPAQLRKVTEELDWRLQSGRRMRDVRLGNHEEPDFSFHA